MENLTNLRICIEKPLPEAIHIREELKKKSNSIHHYNRLSAAFLTAKLWPKGQTVTVSFVDPSTFTKVANWTPIAAMKSKRNQDGTAVKIDPIEYEVRNLTPVEAVKKVVRDRIQPIVDLKFKFVPQDGNIRVGFDSTKGSNSLLGTDCLRSKEPVTLNLGWLDAGTIMHEFGHALGLIHEHQNPRGQEIPWDDAVVYAWAKQTQGWDEQVTFHNIIERYSTDQTNGSDFDPKSIMLYFFPAKLTTNKKGTDANQILSPTDVIYINKQYPGSKLTPAEFYKQAYNIDIDKLKEPTSSDGKVNWKGLATYLFIIIGVLILGFIFYKIFKYIKSLPGKAPSQYGSFQEYKRSVDPVAYLGGPSSPYSSL